MGGPRTSGSVFCEIGKTMDTGPAARRRPVSLANVAIDLRQMRYFIAVAST